MQTYKFSKKAEGDLIDIWTYSFDRWGKIQADHYVQALYSAICLLVENPQMGKSRDAFGTGYRSHCQGKHIIFYRPTHYGIRIIRLLHQSMDSEQYLS